MQWYKAGDHEHMLKLNGEQHPVSDDPKGYDIYTAL